MAKIVMLSTADYAGSGMRIRDAIRQYHPEHKIILITAKKSKRGSDYVLSKVIPGVVKRAEGRSIRRRRPSRYEAKRYDKAVALSCRRIQRLVDDCDIIHFKGDEPPTRIWQKYIKIPKDKKIIVTVGGSGFRRGLDNHAISKAWFGFEHYMKADLRTALTAELNYDGYKGIYTQQAIDSESHENTFTPPDGQIVIAHSPSSRKKKGTDDIFFPVIEKLRKNGYNIKVELIYKVPFERCVEIKKSAHVFFDQTGCGFYGNSALEAMQFGIPTICHICRDAMKQSDGKITRKHPMGYFHSSNKVSCYRAFQKLLDSDLLEISRKTKEFCDNFHSYRVVADMWDKLYRGLLE